MREALADDPGALVDALAGDTDADVVVVGGGYTGMWTAWFVTELAPATDVVLLEAGVCGGGPSGRNGGFLNAWWDELPTLTDLYGEEAALAAARASGASVGEIGDWCATHGVEAWFVGNGFLAVASSPAQAGSWSEAVRMARALGVGDEYVELTREEVAARCRSPVFGPGVLMRDGGTVHPARLARGLRRVLLERGVRIHERTAVTGFREGASGVEMRTPGGVVRAAHAVLGLNAWAIALPLVGPRLATWGSYIVLTEPAPERLEGIGWTGGEGIADSRFALHYFRTTRDGRIAFGGGGGRAGIGSRVTRRMWFDDESFRRAAEGLRRLFPSFAGVPLGAAWGGPIDVSPTHLPFVATLGAGNVHAAAGYSGNGVAPSHLMGKVLARLALERDDDLTRLPFVERLPRRFPPEPLRSAGAHLVREAVVRMERAQDEGRRPNPLVRQVAKLPGRLGYHVGP
jgi:glycine/D-amino acid oxidase-like deaminating enzyme